MSKEHLARTDWKTFRQLAPDTYDSVLALGKIAEQNTVLVRNAGLAGVLSRSLAQRANVVNALQFAADRGVTYAGPNDPWRFDLSYTLPGDADELESHHHVEVDVLGGLGLSSR